MLRDWNSTWNTVPRDQTNAMNDHPLVYSTAWPAWNMCDADVGREPLQIASGTANYHDCEGLFTFKNCTLVPAVLDYDVTVKNNIVTYSPPTERSHVVAISGGYCQNSTVLAVMGFTSMMQPYITANGSLGRWYNLLGDSEEHPIETYNTQTFTSFSMSYLDITPGTDACTITTRDPYSDIVDAFNDLLFRSGVYLGKQANLPDLVDEPFPVRQTMRASLTRDQNVFHSDFHWFAAAAAVQILAVLLILPAYWGEFPPFLHLCPD